MMTKNCLFAKAPLLLAALLFGAVAADHPAARAEDAQAPTPVNFPSDQTPPEPGPTTDDDSDKVTLLQLPDELKAIIETDNGEFMGFITVLGLIPLKIKIKNSRCFCTWVDYWSQCSKCSLAR